MKIKKFSLSLILLVSFSTQSNAELGFSFKSPAFNGNGYSSHVLSVEQLTHNRKKDVIDKAEAEQRRIERELENTTLNKFIKNLESRIYATLSKQMVDSMFSDCTGDTCPTTGTTEIEGSTIEWSKDPVTGSITLTIANDDGTTTITIPGEGEFAF
jgi:hypothetical protein